MKSLKILVCFSLILGFISCADTSQENIKQLESIEKEFNQHLGEDFKLDVTSMSEKEQQYLISYYKEKGVSAPEPESLGPPPNNSGPEGISKLQVDFGKNGTGYGPTYALNLAMTQPSIVVRKGAKCYVAGFHSFQFTNVGGVYLRYKKNLISETDLATASGTYSLIYENAEKCSCPPYSGSTVTAYVFHGSLFSWFDASKNVFIDTPTPFYLDGDNWCN